MTDEMLRQAIAAYKSGRKAKARRLLEQILERDASNETAWLWLSGTAETVEERRACLERVLELNPGNDRAKRGLERLQAVRQTLSSGSELRPGLTEAAGVGGASRPAPVKADAAGWRPSSSRVPGPKLANAAVAKRGLSTVDQALRVVAGLVFGAVVALFAYLIVSSDLGSLTSTSLVSARPTEPPAEPVWQQLGTQQGGFFIMMPGTPESDVQDVITPVGSLELHTHALDTGEFSYMVAYNDYPQYLVRNANVDEMLDGARDGAVDNVNGTLVGERRIRLQGHPGRELWIEATMKGQRGLAQARIYLVDARLYQVIAGGLKDSFSESNAERFLNSFLLVQ